jgi:hypothetical protein
MLKEGIFVGSDIRKLLSDDLFETTNENSWKGGLECF